MTSLSIRNEIISDLCIYTIPYSFCIVFMLVLILYQIQHRHRVDKCFSIILCKPPPWEEKYVATPHSLERRPLSIKIAKYNYSSGLYTPLSTLHHASKWGTPHYRVFRSDLTTVHSNKSGVKTNCGFSEFA